MVKRIRLKTYIILFFSFLFFFCMNTFLFKNIDIQANSSKTEDNYSYSTILVSSSNNELKKEDLNDIQIQKIVDIKKEVSKYQICDNLSNNRNIYKIELLTNDKDSLFKNINKLAKYDFINNISLDYYLEFDQLNLEDLLYDYNHGSDQYSQWGLNSIGLENAWDYTKGDSSIKVAIIDSGICFDHEDLVNNIDNNLSCKIVDGIFTSLSYDEDAFSHGTFVSGIIGASHNQVGIAGVCDNIDLVDIRIYGLNSAKSSDLIYAIYYADCVNIPIINCSISWLNSDNQYNEAVDIAIEDYDGLFVCSAGNDSMNINNNVFPASYQTNNMIVVGSINENNNRSSFSNYGQCVNIYAPGENILSTYTTSINASSSDGFQRVNIENIEYNYAINSGTSFSTPFVSGVAALLLSVNPDLTTSQLRESIINSAQIIGNLRILRAKDAVEYSIENFVTSYVLSSNMSPIVVNDFLYSDSNIYLQRNSIYRLIPSESRYYCINIQSSADLSINIYSDNHSVISSTYYVDNSYYFYPYLESNVSYYLYINENGYDSDCGYRLNIITNNQESLQLTNENNILLDYYNGINEHIFNNTNSNGIFSISVINDIYESNNLEECSLIVKDINNNIIQKIENPNNIIYANNVNTNSIFVYLEEGASYKIYCDAPNNNYSYFVMLIKNISNIEIDLLDDFENIQEINLIDSCCVDDGLLISLAQSGKFNINIQFDNNDFMNIIVAIFKKGDIHNYYLFENISYSNLISAELSLLQGDYYVCILNNKVHYNLSIRRIIMNNNNRYSSLYPDISLDYDVGSEVLLNNGSYSSNSITIGFTRHLNFIYSSHVYSYSRLDYDFYSTNEYIAKVTSYGTVLGIHPGTSYIYAVYKENPSLIYRCIINVISDSGSIRTINSTINHTYDYNPSVNNYQLELFDEECPYPWIQYYNWTIENNSINATISEYGLISINRPGTITLTGSYYINNKITISIIVSFI